VRARGRRQGSTQRRQTTVRGRTSRGVARAGEARRPDHARRPGVAAALDVQEHARVSARDVRGTASGSATRRWPSCCATTATACRRRTSPSKVRAASRSQRAVRAHQREGAGLPRARRAGALRRHQEEGARRQLQERRTRVAARGRARAGGRPRLSVSDAIGKAIPYGVYDLARQRRLRQRRHRPRHAGVRRHDDRGMVEAGRREALPRGARDLHHRRRRRQQQLPLARLEAPTAAGRRQARHRDPRQPLSARREDAGSSAASRR
jgi:hypothetical protein